MKNEIERKFLVRGNFLPYATSRTRMVQGYLSSVPERTVRIRIAGEHATLTIKGVGSATGTTRLEWETVIPVEQAEQLLQICEPGVIDKTRYLIPAGAHTFEVDEFHGENQGLVVAEIELAHENESFESPEWLGEEVTGDERYYNSMLTKHPYQSWVS